MRLGVGLILGCVGLLARSQVTHTVSVGQFYVPPTISALEGDIVQFLFTAGHHGVTQGVGIFDPCSQIPGGFNSGIIAGFEANETNQSPVWSLSVTNASAPIFFYCAATVPSFHCANGMVGAINSSPDQYTSYSLAAKSLVGTPVQTSSVVLTGVGAVATTAPFTPTPSALPTTTTTPSSDIPSPTAATTSSEFPSETPTHSNKSNAAAIGGGIAGGIAGVIIAVLGFLLYRSRRQRAADAAAVNESFLNVEGEKYHLRRDPASPPGLGGFDSSNINQSDPFMSTGSASALQRSRTVGSRQPTNTEGGSVAPYSRGTTYTMTSAPFSSAEPPLSGVLPGQEFGMGPQGSPEQATFQHQRQQQSRFPTLTHSPNVNVHEIAKEVATLLGPQLRVANPASPPPAAHSARSLPKPYGLSAQDHELPRSPAPPQYKQYDRN